MSSEKGIDVNKMLDDFLGEKEREYVRDIEEIRRAKEQYARCISNEEHFSKDLESIRLMRKQIQRVIIKDWVGEDCKGE